MNAKDTTPATLDHLLAALNEMTGEMMGQNEHLASISDSLERIAKALERSGDDGR